MTVAQLKRHCREYRGHLLVGIEADGNFERVVRAAGVVAGDTAPRGELVDATRVVRSDKGLAAYFIRDVEPFYRRARGGWLKSLFGAGR